MRALKRFLILLPLFSIIACSQEQPILIPEDKAELFGVWIYKNDEYGNNVKIDNMLLAFHKDSSVSYKRCIKRMNGHKNTSVPEAKIIKLTDQELVIKVSFVFFRIRLNFDIDQLPYKENDDWYMKVDGALLRRLRPGEKSDHETWDCGKDTEQTKEKTEGVKI